MKGENHNPLFPKMEDRSKKMPPQDRVVFDCKIDLAGLPDETYGVEVLNEKKELMKEVTGDKPLEEHQFRVDYTHGYLYFHPVHNKKTVTIQKYYSRGMLYFPASRVYSIDEHGRIDINNTLQDYIDSIKTWIFQGEYQAGKSYTANNSVYSDGSIYIAKQDVPANKIPKKNPAYWQPMSSGFLYRGEYNSSEVYYPREIVAYKKGYYACLQEVSGSTPGSGAAWQEIVSVDSIYEAWQGTDGNGGLKREIAKTLERVENTRDAIVQEWEGTENSEGLKQQLENMLDSVVVEDNLTSTSTTSSLSANQGKVLNDTKADKQTAQGGFVGGEGAINYDDDYGEGSGTGAAIGKGAFAVAGGASIGEGTYTEIGGSIGYHAYSMVGGAVGMNARDEGGGFAGGKNAVAANQGGAIGGGSKASDGGAVGMNATTSDGFAGGSNAKTIDANNNGIDAIQLGTGTNTTPKTLQVYDYQLLDADGNIPAERLTNAPSGGGDWINGEPITNINAANIKSGVYKIMIENLSEEEKSYLPNHIASGGEGAATFISIGGDGYLIQYITCDGSPNGDGSVFMRKINVSGQSVCDWIELWDAGGTSIFSWILTTKADKQTVSGGFVAGEGAEEANSGVAIGKGSSSNDGASVGWNAVNYRNGGAVGKNTETGSGFAGGSGAKSDNGGAVGWNAETGNGFAGGSHAKTIDASGNGIDAIQLGTGTNYTPKTLQVYDYQLLDADGNIPAARLANVGGGVGKSMAGETVQPTSTTTVTAGVGAEIFNDYSDRTYSGSLVDAGNIASGNFSHAEGSRTTASGEFSHAEGYKTIASGDYSHAEGNITTASNIHSHSEGSGTIASGSSSHAEGIGTEATIVGSHAEGGGTIASGAYSHAEGKETKVNGDYSHAEGYKTTASGHHAHVEGHYTEAGNYQHVQGKYNKISAGPTTMDDTTGDIFIIGNGTDTNARKNALRTTTAGKTYGAQAFSGSGADYAEFFEWQDGNPNEEDRRGLFVTLDGEKIRKATNEDDFILGVVSVNACFEGDSQSEIWKGMYLKDVFGENLTEVVEVPETTDEETGTITPTHTETRWILNDAYDSDKDYVPRENRKEWSAVGLIGKLVVVDDGTCEVNGYCKSSAGGIGTKSEEKTAYRVMERLDNTHVRVVVK